MHPHVEGGFGGPHRREKPVSGLVAAHFPHLFREYRIVFDPMTVTVDHRVLKTFPDFGGGLVLMTCHFFLLIVSDVEVTLVEQKRSTNRLASQIAPGSKSVRTSAGRTSA
jgi:hypothetical protein